MPMFRYVALTPGGERQTGTMEAATEAAVIDRLQRQGNIPVKAEPADGKAEGLFAGLLATSFGGGGKAIGAQELTNATRELAVMLGAGQDLDRALRFLEETAPNPRVAGVMGALRNAVRDGSPLARAMAAHPRSFSRLYVGLVRAGEAGGTLAPTLERLAELLERQRALAATITSAMVYPCLLILASIGAVALLLTEVLPQFVPLFQQSGASLPPSTQFLIDAGHWVGAYGPAAVAALLALGLIARAALRRPSVRLPADRLLLRVPILGGLMREVQAARFSRTLGTLLINGVSLIAALGIVRDATTNQAVVVAIDRASASARDGAGLSRPLAESGVFPVRTGYLLRLGEENAQLGPMALRAADIHEEKARLGVQRVVALLVPTITIIMGAVVAGIVSSLLLAMLSLNDLAN